jgi:hypothetical protein
MKHALLFLVCAGLAYALRDTQPALAFLAALAGLYGPWRAFLAVVR